MEIDRPSEIRTLVEVQGDTPIRSTVGGVATKVAGGVRYVPAAIA